MGDLPQRTAEINAECCDEPGEDCSGGLPHTCNSDCAAVLLPFWGDCRTALGPGAAQFEPAVQLCQATSSGVGADLAEQLSLACTDDSLSHDECVPDCGRDLHGFLLLLNIDGDDSKLSCELRHGMYSWLGPATDGGFIGSDIITFLSAITSAAPGTFMVTP